MPQLKDYIINHFSDAIGSLNVTVAQDYALNIMKLANK